MHKFNGPKNYVTRLFFFYAYRWCKSNPRTSTISLNFWLSWSFDMVSRASMTKSMREACVASTLQA